MLPVTAIAASGFYQGRERDRLNRLPFSEDIDQLLSEEFWN